MIWFLTILISSNAVLGENPFFHVVEEPEDKWINLFDDFFGSRSVKPTGTNPLVKSTSESKDISFPKQRSCDCRCEEKLITNPVNACTSFLQRFVNIILRNTGLKNYYMRSGDKQKTITVDLSVTPKTLKILQDFIDDKEVSFQELDECFLTFFKTVNFNPEKKGNSFKDNVEDIVFEYDEDPMSFYEVISNKQNIHVYLMVFASMAVIALYLKYSFSRSGFKGTLLLLFILYYLASVIQLLWTQYEEVEKKRILSLEESLSNGGVHKIPDSCYPNKMNFFKKLYYAFDDECERYFESKKIFFSHIDLHKTFMDPIYAIIFGFIPSLFNTMGSSISRFSGHFPFPTLMSYFMVIVFIIVGICLIKYAISSYIFWRIFSPLKPIRTQEPNHIEENHSSTRLATPKMDTAQWPPGSTRSRGITAPTTAAQSPTGFGESCITDDCQANKANNVSFTMNLALPGPSFPIGKKIQPNPFKQIQNRRRFVKKKKEPKFQNVLSKKAEEK